jgi:hypothetical protein
MVGPTPVPALATQVLTLLEDVTHRPSSRLPTAAVRAPRVEPPADPSPRHRGLGIGMVLALVAFGLLVQAVGYAVGRSGDTGVALTGFFVGLLIIFVPCAWSLLAPETDRRQRIATVIVLGVGLAVSNYLFNPLLFGGFDDLLHQTSLWHLAYGRSLTATNTELPVSPYYPALEALTVGIKWMTGLPMVVCELAVVLLSRLVLILTVYLLCERLTRSERGGGIGVLVYVLSPQFYSFNASYSYQTIALAFGAGAVYFLIAAVDRRKPKAARHFRLSIFCLIGTILAHHLIGILTVGLLVAWAAVLLGAGSPTDRQRARSRLVSRAALIGTVMLVVWTAVSARQVFSYLDPILVAAWKGIIGTLTGSGASRSLFHSASGAVTPRWQQLLLILSPLILLASLVPAVRAVVWRRQLRGGWQRFIPAAIALGFLGVLGSRLSGSASDVGARASTFVFFGLALCIAAWFVRTRPQVSIVVLVTLASVCFLGSMILGSGPSSTYTPGPFLPAADQRSIDAASVAAATWASTHLPANASVAADRDNAALMAAIGHLSPVTALSGQVNVGPIYFDSTFGTYERTLIRTHHIQYLVVDDRLLLGPPASGYYFEPGETNGVDRLTSQELGTFDHVSGMTRIYDNGPIHIYSLASLDGLPATSVPITTYGSAGRGANLWVLVPFVVVSAVWIRVAVGRRRPDGLESMVGWMLSAMGVAIAGTVAFVPTGLPATPVALVVLVGLLVMGTRNQVDWLEVARPLLHRRWPTRATLCAVVARLWTSVRDTTRTGLAEAVAWGRHQTGRHLIQWLRPHRGAVVGVLTAIGAVSVATASAASDWSSPTALSLTTGPGGGASVQTVVPASEPAASVTTASVEVLRLSKVTWSRVVPVGPDTVTVPRSDLGSSAQVALVVGGLVVRTVHG